MILQQLRQTTLVKESLSPSLYTYIYKHVRAFKIEVQRKQK